MSILENFFDYFLSKSKQIREKSYKNYHQTVRRIVLDEVNPKDNVMLSVQQAAIFELRFYKQYFNVSLRIMDKLSDSWKKTELIKYYRKEFEETKAYILDKQNKWNQVKALILDFLKYSIGAFLVYFIILVIKKITPIIVSSFLKF